MWFDIIEEKCQTIQNEERQISVYQFMIEYKRNNDPMYGRIIVFVFFENK